MFLSYAVSQRSGSVFQLLWMLSLGRGSRGVSGGLEGSRGGCWAQMGAFVFKQTTFRCLMFAHSALKCTSCVKLYRQQLKVLSALAVCKTKDDFGTLSLIWSKVSTEMWIIIIIWVFSVICITDLLKWHIIESYTAGMNINQTWFKGLCDNLIFLHNENESNFRSIKVICIIWLHLFYTSRCLLFYRFVAIADYSTDNKKTNVLFYLFKWINKKCSQTKSFV